MKRSVKDQHLLIQKPSKDHPETLQQTSNYQQIETTRSSMEAHAVLAWSMDLKAHVPNEREPELHEGRASFRPPTWGRYLAFRN